MSFLILPDSPAAEPAARAAATPPGVRTIPHASGRPWLVGRFTDDELTLVERGPRRLALVGTAAADRDTLGRILARATDPRDLDAVARHVAGCYHLLASLDGRVRAQGTLATVRQVFHARVAGVTLAADSPEELTALLGDHARLDEDMLAAQLLLPVPYPLFQRPLWTGVAALGVGRFLDLPPDGRAREVTWWTPPDPTTPLADAVAPLREALTAAVAARARGASLVSADLSGGLDSTSLCFLAAATGTPLLTHHWRPRDRANTDTTWARRAAELLPEARHRFAEPGEAPQWFDVATEAAAEETTDDVEGPLTWSRNRAHTATLARQVAAAGSRHHLLGVGGDELFGVAPQFLWSLLRSDPWYGLRMARRFRRLNRWPLGPTVRLLADRRDFARTLADLADAVDAPPPRPFTPPTGWGRGDPRMPPWATGDAVATVRRLLRETAAGRPAPLHRDRLQHQTLEVCVHSGHAARQLNRALAGLGVTFDTPFLDDRVVEAAVAVRVADRVRPGQYKPVLRAALRGAVPDAVLDRRDKGAFDREAYDGLHRNRERLAARCADLRLAERGLVDAAAFRAALHALLPVTRQLGPFENTLACEAWLRSPSSAGPASPAAGPPAPTTPAPAGGPR